VIESLPSNDAGTQKRRSTRIVQAVPIIVTGVDALGQPFKERTTTVMVNCHGCKYQSKHYVPKNSTITLEIPRLESQLPSRTVTGRVVWVQRPRTVRELFQIGLEFEVAGNVWGIAFPPEDWFPYPGDEAAATPTPSEAAPTLEAVPPATQQEPAAPVPATPEAKAQPPAAAPAVTAPTATAPPAAPAAPETPSADSKIHVMPRAGQAQDTQLATAQDMAKMVADAKVTLDKTVRKDAQTAINEEMTLVRQQLDAQLHEAVERAIKISMERVSESAAKKVVQQAAERTTAIVEEARKANEAGVQQLDVKIRRAVQDAVSHAAEEAAQQAAQQTAAQNLKQTVEEAVERVISEREAASPSLQILSSPEAAQRHLDEWKKSLEETAHKVRNQTVEQVQAGATATSKQWNDEFEAALKGASQKLGEKLGEVSQGALAQAEQVIAARNTDLRASIADAVAGAEATVQSLGAGLEQERARTEQAKAQLQEAAKSALEQTRQHVDELLSSRSEEIGRKVEQVIGERAKGIEPLIEQSAQKTIERVSDEVDQKLAPKLDAAQKAASDLAQAREQAAQIQNTLREQTEHASAQAAQIETTIRQQVEQVSERAIQESLDRLRQETAKYPAEFDQSCRAALSKVEEELEQKSTETQHATYEALLKASDWYQKKAQTTMQSTMEKTVEQSTSTLRNRAAEISSLVASELDHYGRTYVEHSQAQIEEAAKEVMDRERGKLGEAADVAGASFSDRVQQVTADSLRRFEDASRQALEKARSDMEYNREGSLEAFQKSLDDKMLRSVEQAQTYLQSQLVPLIEELEKNRQVQQQAWMEQLKKSTDESIEQYKTRLENASNSWLLASATTLGQHSQAVLDTLAKSAEKRIRETCAEVLAGMGDTIKQRLAGISGQFDTDKDDEASRRKK
jgi:hypothetical protein